ncbi:hypothetical protein BDZ94DRAFT_1284344 [Collybia nuda]|uniref:Uncharacterized protein n=1 Tax=Collybia nuda TaxID=64659 RepID=A0A9P5XZJ5_9AGAR|nr:hypothetical protein BDZ94DRAFT_1284344 [Collybia nuda]
MATSKAENGMRKKRARSPEDTTTTPTQNALQKRPKTTVSTPVVLEDKIFSGNFDIYSMRLPFLAKEYLSKESSIPQFEQLYKTILTYQAKNDRTGQCFLANANTNGRFRAPSLQDPMEGFPFDITINSITIKDPLTFSSSELANFLTPKTIKKERGVTAMMKLVDDHCGIASASGSFKMTRAWMKAATGDEEPAELFEGHAAFKVNFSGLYKRKGHGSGTSCEFAFWAIRAKKDENGEEIGLGSRL